MRACVGTSHLFMLRSWVTATERVVLPAVVCFSFRALSASPNLCQHIAGGRQLRRDLHDGSDDTEALEVRAMEEDARRLSADLAASELLHVPSGSVGKDTHGGGEVDDNAEVLEEPTLADLDRSIPQVDCEFMASLCRSRTMRREAFLRRKAQVKAKVEALTRKEMRSVSDTERVPLVGALGQWRSRFMQPDENREETALAATSGESAVLASPGATEGLNEEDLDALHSARPEYDDGFILLDCRTVNEVTSWGIIEGAKVLPAHELFSAFHATPDDFKAMYGFDKPRPEDMVICYCQYGPRSLMAAQMLSWMGYRKVLHFRDGYYEWGKQYNLLLRRWMEHDKSTGNELQRLSTFRAALEMQREIAPEFNALPMKEASRYSIDVSRSRGTLLVGEGLRLEAYAAVAKLVDKLLPGPEEKPLPPSSSSQPLLTGLSQQHLNKFLAEATGVDLAQDMPAEGGNMAISDAQAAAVQDPMRLFSGRGGYLDRDRPMRR